VANRKLVAKGDLQKLAERKVERGFRHLDQRCHISLANLTSQPKNPIKAKAENYKYTSNK
jgi:hypothetical protein